MKDHWNKIYDTAEHSKLGWYEKTPELSLKLIDRCNLQQDDPLLDVGAGETTLIHHLIKKGFCKIIAVDISRIALQKLQSHLEDEESSCVSWIEDDLTAPRHLQHLNNIALWHDRAVLHFLVEESQQETYCMILKQILRQGGYVIIAAFSLKGANMCSGLPVRKYDQHMLAALLGEDFELLEYFDHIHMSPAGDPKPYIYTLFRKKPEKI